MTHSVLTFISRVTPTKADALRALLEKIGDDPEDNPYVPFRKLKLLHFASFTLHESHKQYGPYLIFENNFDGPLGPYLEDLYGRASQGLHDIYSHCQDYSLAAGDREGMLAYLRAHVVRPNAYHIGNTGRRVGRILQEQELRDAVEARADSLPKKAAPEELFEKLKDSVRADPKFSWVPGAEPRQTFLEHYVPWVKLVLQGLLAALIVLALFPFVLIALWVLRRKEETDPVQSDTADTANIEKIVEREDRTHNVQNHMSSITIVKPGWLRRLTLWLVLWAVNLLARARATHGELSGIPSIHFAHWSMIDGGRRLLFVSNFDGSWENYLDDFIDKAHTGLTAVWSNTAGFPRARFLVEGGATDGPRFKAVARDNQTVTNAWYSAYRDLTVRNIDNSSSLREDIFKPLDEQGKVTWLQRL